jgi:hypothetical protein
MAMFERRSGGGVPSLDRRKTYMDILERVMGCSIPTVAWERRSLLLSELTFAGPVGIATATAVHVTVLDGIARDRKR